jgi:hypothetical protein
MVVNEVAVKSPIVSAMGARISVTGPGRGMYLVIGRSTSLESLVKPTGGEIVLRLNGRKMLVTLPFAGYLSLRGNYQISHIGPVTVDIKRLAKVAEMLAKTSSPEPGGAG